MRLRLFRRIVLFYALFFVTMFSSHRSMASEDECEVPWKEKKWVVTNFETCEKLEESCDIGRKNFNHYDLKIFCQACLIKTIKKSPYKYSVSQGVENLGECSVGDEKISLLTKKAEISALEKKSKRQVIKFLIGEILNAKKENFDDAVKKDFDPYMVDYALVTLFGGSSSVVDTNSIDTNDANSLTASTTTTQATSPSSLIGSLTLPSGLSLDSLILNSETTPSTQETVTIKPSLSDFVTTMDSNSLSNLIENTQNVLDGNSATWLPDAKFTVGSFTGNTGYTADGNSPTNLSTLVKEDEFCWKNTETRGVGTIPTKCESSKEMIGILCYDKCKSGESRFGFDCHSNCPAEAGWSDDGLYCRRYEYGRGTGGCTGSSCESYGGISYPKCDSGYSSFGCCICRPDNFACSDYGLGDQVDLSCAKKVTIGSPSIGICEDDEDLNAGLCYPKCKDGFIGIGPVCWAKVPPFSGWVDCGMGFAKDDVTCGFIITDQVLSVANMVISLATMGVGTAATAGVRTALKTTTEVIETSITISSTMHSMYDIATAGNEEGAAEEGVDFAKDVAGNLINIAGGILVGADNLGDFATTAAGTIEKMDTAIQDENPEVLIDSAIEIASLFDPTGITGVISAYKFPICGDVENAYSDSELGEAVTLEKNSLEEPSEEVSICISKKDSAHSEDICLLASESTPKFGDSLKLKGTYSSNKNLLGGVFLISPIEAESSYYTICLSGQQAKGDSKTPLCLKAEENNENEMVLVLKGTQEQNRQDPYGIFQIKKVDSDKPYLSICFGGQPNTELKEGDICLTPKEGIKEGSLIVAEPYKTKRIDTSKNKAPSKDQIKNLGIKLNKEVNGNYFEEDLGYFIFK